MFLTAASAWGVALGLLLVLSTGRLAAAETPPAARVPVIGAPQPPPDRDPSLSATETPIDEVSVLAPAIVELPPSSRRPRWAGRVSLGAVYRWAFGEGMGGGALEGELGAQNPRLNGGVRLRIEVGKMVVDLPYQVVSFGPFIWLPPVGQRVRVGFGLEGGALVISRRTMPGSTLWSILMGGQVRLSTDLVRIGPSGALQVEGGLTVEALTAAPGPLTVATTFGFGYRP